MACEVKVHILVLNYSITVVDQVTSISLSLSPTHPPSQLWKIAPQANSDSMGCKTVINWKHCSIGSLAKTERLLECGVTPRQQPHCKLAGHNNKISMRFGPEFVILESTGTMEKARLSMMQVGYGWLVTSLKGNRYAEIKRGRGKGRSKRGTTLNLQGLYSKLRVG